MTYTFHKTLPGRTVDEAVTAVTAALQEQGFGILTEIDVRATLKQKLDAEFRDYRILGACNPPLAHRALQAEDRIGAMLPCNVIVQARDDGAEVAAIDPVASMQAVDNDALRPIAEEVRDRLKSVVETL
ncbi:DUF302 domain-containing protein [Roseospira goensis]|uniref:Uncharacterized protein (DUF302 family) n=1 Tax=Roseospira goensis TaxID=391922 RepID=A0A7W6RZ09_9PROT|nr:DUF302 domain-containing protein [Roseospira goensis]MBB4285162.1 uncharacterized protein (DUF302 family) [Roseospira goensis]